MKRLKKEDRAGLYITVIVHLTVIIVLLASQLSLALRKEDSFVLDFTRQETIEKLEKEPALTEDAELLQEALNNTFNREDNPEEYIPIAPPPSTEGSDKKTQKEVYSGPSVVSYSLDGRKASRLPIPAYRCMGSGEVTVIITVDNAGNVLIAKIDDNISSSDTCLRNFAIRAARSAKFSASPTAPARQVGNIVYAFIAQ